jgi:hypothetical protein
LKKNLSLPIVIVNQEIEWIQDQDLNKSRERTGGDGRYSGLKKWKFQWPAPRAAQADVGAI